MNARAWAPLAAVCAVALLRALTSSPPEQFPESDDELLHKAFRAIAGEEAALRRDSAKSFPTDTWSRDDDFHRREEEKARDWGGNHHVRKGDVLWAIDEGIRRRWPYGGWNPLVATTPPCRPRAIY